jgi:hypothetical protein
MVSSIAITAVTVTGSILSMVGAGFVLICYAILPFEHHFRHGLILNLAVSDFLNSLNNSVAGLQILASKKGLSDGWGCTLNGFVGQVTVQATDCTILAIAVTTVFTIVQRESMASETAWRPGQELLICCAIWILPFFTGFFALGMQLYAPASGNWCWIESEPVYLRYVLTHGWRFLFIFVEIALYTYLDIHLRRHYNNISDSLPRDIGRNLRLSGLSAIVDGNSNFPSPDGTALASIGPSEKPNAVHNQVSSSTMLSSTTSQSSASASIPQPKPRVSWSFGRITGLRAASRSSRCNNTINPQYQALHRVLLLNAYPLAYILLWVPGMVNRLIEASGHESSLAQLFQASAQLVGLANALTYGWNERVSTKLRERFRART